MTALAIVFATVAWAPLASTADLDARLALAAVISEVETTDHEALLLARIALFESRFVPRVVNCAKGTTKAGRGAFGVMARRHSEYAGACGFTVEAVELALARLRESRAACPWLAPADSLAVYASGKCSSREGKRLSRMRWVEKPS